MSEEKEERGGEEDVCRKKETKENNGWFCFSVCLMEGKEKEEEKKKVNKEKETMWIDWERRKGITWPEGELRAKLHFNISLR